MEPYIEAVKRLPKGARRAFEAMTGELLRPGKTTFAWAGAEQAVKRIPELVKREAVKGPRALHARDHYRLTILGELVKAEIARAAQ